MTWGEGSLAPPGAALPCRPAKLFLPKGSPLQHRHPWRPRAHPDLCTVTKGRDADTGNRAQTTDRRQLVRKALSGVQQPGVDSRGPAGDV